MGFMMAFWAISMSESMGFSIRDAKVLRLRPTGARKRKAVCGNVRLRSRPDGRFSDPPLSRDDRA
jgi:hypothetical protein